MADDPNTGEGGGVRRERRRHPRYDARGLFGTWNHQVGFAVVQISRSGLQARMEVEPILGETAPLVIGLGDAGPFRCSGRVVYIGPEVGGASSAFRVGIAFEQMEPAMESRLGAYIDEVLAPRAAGPSWSRRRRSAPAPGAGRTHAELPKVSREDDPQRGGGGPADPGP